MLTFYSAVQSSDTAVLLIAFLSVFYYFCTYTYDHWRKRNVPYLRPVPLFGNFLKAAFGVKHPFEIVETVYRHPSDRKCIGFYQMRVPMLLIRDPELINGILIKDFAHFTDRGIPVDEKAPLANHLLSMRGQQWKIMRSKMSPVFTSRMLKNMYSQITECSTELLKNLKAHLTKTDVLEVRNIMGNYSTDVIGTCAFGLHLNSITDHDSPFRQAGRAIFNPSFKTSLANMLMLVSPTIKKKLKIRDLPPHITDFFINAFTDTIRYRQNNDMVRDDLVQCLIQANTDLVINKTEPSVVFKETDIIANAFLMFLAGFETVSSTMSYCLYELALNKTIQDRVREEVAHTKTKYNGDISRDYLQDLRYLNMVIAETLRKYPPGTMIMREATIAYKVPEDDIIIDKGEKIIIPIYNIHMDSKYYPDPQKFDPERFTQEEKCKRPSCSYIPFGEGPRLCLGKRFAEMEMKLALTELLTAYEVEPCDKTVVPLTYKVRAPTLTPVSGIWLKFKTIQSNLNY